MLITKILAALFASISLKFDQIRLLRINSVLVSLEGNSPETPETEFTLPARK